MDVLQIPFGTACETLDVIQEDWFGEDAVAFNLPQDGRIVTREHIAGLIEWLQGFLEETKTPLPTLYGAAIKAVLTDGQGTATLLLVPDGPDDDIPWKRANAPRGEKRWYAAFEIASFEVLFPGVES